MLPAPYRLRKDKDVERVLKSKRGVFDPICGVKFFPNGLPESRFAVVVGGKVSKSAVERNHVRRQYREVLRLHLREIVPGYDILLLVSKPALTLEYVEKEVRLLKVLSKAKLLGSTARGPQGGDAAHPAVPKNTIA